ncbi:MAG: hypothetical protein K2X81_21720, partial [Candidatus Obscuribacterales bacterium]|nr:hypothetical protein [Candidatus Obscuribacterales bacterium]
STAKANTTKKSGKTKYWICSSGTDYIGYQITVSVNGTPLDSFYGPDKILKITDHLKPGPNTILFDARMVGDKFNKHKGDDKAELVLKLVKGETVQDSFPESDVIATFTRNASETEDYKDSQHIEKAE